MIGRSRTGRRPVLSFFLAAVRASAWPVVRVSALALLAAPFSAVQAQYVVRSWLPWRTVETRHFAFHYPTELEAWTRHVAAHADAIDSAVSAVVGYTPSHRVHVVVDDPYEIANGSAWAFIDQPVIYLWAAPADPREDIGEFTDWGEMLVSHEFGHIAHLVRPSRNAGMRRLWQLLPVDLGPISLNAPRWVLEGYATYIEGRVTGSGRPHGSWRSAFLRQWALEGQLPRYDQLDASGAYEGGEFAYLAGSAFIEWLTARNGDSSLVHLWRRMTARQKRDFDAAFIGVFGESARALYGRFSAELTAKSLDAARAIAAAGSDTGRIVQRLGWSTGDPSISADGQRAAIVLRSPIEPSRVVIWSTAAEPDTGRARRDSILLAHDPEDVPARAIYPPPKRVLAALRATGGSSYEAPRFLRDGRLLLWRNTPRGDGSLAADLYVWDPSHRSVRRVTHGASVRDADPAPDGRSAIATRCRAGWCDVALVDLASGAVRTLLAGSPTVTYYRPRFSPDGARFVVAVNRGGKWELRVARTAGDSSADVSRDGTANWYDAAWRDDQTLIAVGDGGGVPNLYQRSLDAPDSGWRRLTGVTGAAVAPAVDRRNGSIWFLSLYSRGYDLRSIDATASTPRLVLSSSFAPAVAAPAAPVTRLDSDVVSPARPYGFGARSLRWLPLPEADADGVSAALGIVSMDLIGRTRLLAEGALGDPAAWRGGSITFEWRGWRPGFEARAFDAAQRPSASRTPVPGAALLDMRLSGGEIALDDDWSFDAWAARARLGGSVSRAHALVASSPAADRSLAFGTASAGWIQRGAAESLSEALSANLTAGRSFDAAFRRAVVSASVALAGRAVIPVSAAATYGTVSSGAAPFEQLALGGNPSPLIDAALLSQRIAMPALPAGIRAGSSAFTYKATLTGQPLSLYYWGGSTAPAGERFTAWNRVIGVEWTGSIAAVPVAGTPAARGQIGVGESLDAPLRHRVRAYVSVVIGR